jgi:hypothetical protein
LRKAAARVDIAAPSATVGRSTTARPVGTPALTASTASAIAGIDGMARSGRMKRSSALACAAWRWRGAGSPRMRRGRQAPSQTREGRAPSVFPTIVGRTFSGRAKADPAGSDLCRGPGCCLRAPAGHFLAEKGYITCVNLVRTGWLAQRGCSTPVLHGAGNKRSRSIRCWRPQAGWRGN